MASGTSHRCWPGTLGKVRLKGWRLTGENSNGNKHGASLSEWRRRDTTTDRDPVEATAGAVAPTGARECAPPCLEERDQEQAEDWVPGCTRSDTRSWPRPQLGAVGGGKLLPHPAVSEARTDGNPCQEAAGEKEVRQQPEKRREKEQGVNHSQYHRL